MFAASGADAAWLSAAGVFAFVDWYGVLANKPQLRWVGKPMTMVALIAAAVTGAADAGAPAAVRQWIIAGLVLSLVGDVCLQMPNRERWFVRGLAAFLLGHLAYIVACFHLGVSVRPLGLATVVVAILAGFVGIQVIRGAAQQSAKLFKPVAFYVGVISLMVAAAIGTGEWWLIAAAILFYVSDLILGLNAFVRPRSWAPISIMVTYHLAQAGFVVFLLSGGGT